MVLATHDRLLGDSPDQTWLTPRPARPGPLAPEARDRSGLWPAARPVGLRACTTLVGGIGEEAVVIDGERRQDQGAAAPPRHVITTCAVHPLVECAF